MIGLIEGSYEAYCFDQAVWFTVTTIQNEVEKVNQKKAPKQAAQEAARDRKLKQMLGKTEAKGQYADPAAMFSSS